MVRLELGLELQFDQKILTLTPTLTITLHPNACNYIMGSGGPTRKKSLTGCVCVMSYPLTMYVTVRVFPPRDGVPSRRSRDE